MRRIILAAFFYLASTFPSGVAAAENWTTLPSPVRYEPYAIVSPYGPPIVRAELGRFAVLESRGSSTPRPIELAFVRLASTSKNPGSPIVWLAGGPGTSGTHDLDTPLLQLLLELRRLGDVLVLDQRGTGLSRPRLDCPGAFTFPQDVALERPAALAALEAAGRACGEDWRARGTDLSAYNTRESAEDVEDLRRAVGAAKLRLLAGSYGTHLALAAIRAHEDRVERAVLLGVVGPDHLRRVPSDLDTELEAIARLVRENTSSRMPDLLGTIREVRDRLDAHPVRLDVPNREGGRSEVVIGRFELEWYTRSLLSSRPAIAHLPALYADLAAGDYSELGEAALGWRRASAPPAPVFTVRCASGGSTERERRIAEETRSALLQLAGDLAEEGVCRAWGVPRLSDDFRGPVSSRVPVLFVSGTLDGDTPLDNAQEVSRGFPNASRLVIEGGAHWLLGFGDAEPRAAINRFFEGKPVRADRVRLPAIAFEAPRVAPAGARLASRPSFPLPAWFGGGSP
ncbi:MAG: alpha/beta hydrolase [Acidobacteriota bacterium]